VAVKFTELCFDCSDPHGLAEFWSQVLDYKIVDADDDEVEIAGPERSGPSIYFIKVPEGKTVKNRLHIDVSPTGSGQDSEVERVLELGATHADVGQAPDVSWVVLADPEGNEFCILRSEV
jgi:hypothetical protein